MKENKYIYIYIYLTLDQNPKAPFSVFRDSQIHKQELRNKGNDITIITIIDGGNEREYLFGLSQMVDHFIYSVFRNMSYYSGFELYIVGGGVIFIYTIYSYY